MNSINDMHATIDRSLEDRSTSRENSGGLPSSIRLRVQRKNVWTSAAPPMRRKITGETPATSNGASSLALSRPHAFRKLKPADSRMMPVATAPRRPSR